MDPVRFVFGVHFHQPVGNFDHVFEDHLRDVYLPLVERLTARRFLPFALHMSGPLLEWLEQHAGAYLDTIGRLAADGQVELLLAGFYEPVLASLTRADRLEQIGWMRQAIKRRFGVDATGLWLTERVWEPDLAGDLADAGVRYLLVDDRHFLVSGFERDRLHAPFLTESGGKRVALFPIDERLRYLIPFRPPSEIAAYLRELRQAGRPLALFVDDGEKFGGWPGTKDWVYTRGWLAQFCDAVAALVAGGEVRLTTPGTALREVASAGLAYLPTASYREMEAWAPLAARRAIGRAQCNDAYRHGVFGGLYLPHLRAAIWRHLALAEGELRRGEGLAVESLDLDADGAEELWIHSGACSALVSPRRGGVIEEYTVFERGVNYTDVLTRRREPYHLPPADRPGHTESQATDGTPSIHDIEAGARLQRLPPIDHADRALFVDRVLSADVTIDRYSSGAFDSVACWAGTPFRASLEQSAQAVEVVLHPGPSPAGLLEKRIRLDQAGELTVRYRWDPKAFPPDAFFCPEISVSPQVQLELTPAAEVWEFPIATVSRSERGFEETVQGYSYTPRWPIKAGEGRVTVRGRP